MGRILLQSPAKINLGLRVLRKREDGYHDIATIFQELDLCDEIELVEMAAGISVETDSPLIPAGPENLVWKAAQLLNDQSGRNRRGVSIHIKKRIPVSAGLGGGSSNASAVLTGLNRMWDLRLPQSELMRFAAKIGSDCPFFLLGKSAVGTGRGEILQNIPIRGTCHIVLVNPGFGVSTPWAFGKVKPGLTKKEQKNIMDDFSSGFEMAEIASCMENDLEGVVITKYPVIGAIKRMLECKGATKALMSGSGATVFGVFLRESDARRALVAAQQEGWISFLTVPVYDAPEKSFC